MQEGLKCDEGNSWERMGSRKRLNANILRLDKIYNWLWMHDLWFLNAIAIKESQIFSGIVDNFKELHWRTYS